MLVSISFVVTFDTSDSQPRHWILTIRKISKNATEKRQHATANQTKLRCTKHPPHPTHSLSEHRQRHIASIAACRPAFCFISDPHDGSIVSAAPYFFHRSEFFFIHYRQRSLGAYDGDDTDARRRPLRVILFFTTHATDLFHPLFVIFSLSPIS